MGRTIIQYCNRKLILPVIDKDMLRLFELVSKWRVFSLVLIMLVVNSLEVLGLSLFIPIIDLFQGENDKLAGPTIYLSRIVTAIGLSPGLGVFLVLLSGLFLIKGILAMWMRYLGVTMASGLQHQLRSRLFGAFLKSTVAFIHRQRQGALLSILSEHTVRTGHSFFVLVQIATQWATALACIVFVLLISWKLSLVAFALSLLLFPVIRWIGRQAYRYGRDLTSALEKAQHSALEALRAKKLVNAMDWKRPLEDRYLKDSSAVRDNWQWMAFWSNSPSIVLQPLSVVLLSIVIWLSFRLDLSTALLGAFALAFIRLLPSVQAALTLGADFKASIPSIKRVLSMLREVEKEQELNGTLPFESLRSAIYLKSIRFCYGDSRPVLDGLSLEIPKGKITALVGPSGVGKTTVVDLILGLYRPESGQVLVDGIDLKELDLKSYRSRIAYISQEPILFHDTIRNNLTLGLEKKVSDEELRRVCELVGAWDFIKQRREGLDSLIGSCGVQLSGGQRQRLVLARALLREPELLILDEATSALDHESEENIKKMLGRLKASGRVTIIIIAHRLTTVQLADCIYQLINGKAFMLGSWEKAKEHLLTTQGIELI